MPRTFVWHPSKGPRKTPKQELPAKGSVRIKQVGRVLCDSGVVLCIGPDPKGPPVTEYPSIPAEEALLDPCQRYPGTRQVQDARNRHR